MSRYQPISTLAAFRGTGFPSKYGSPKPHSSAGAWSKGPWHPWHHVEMGWEWTSDWIRRPTFPSLDVNNVNNCPTSQVWIPISRWVPCSPPGLWVDVVLWIHTELGSIQHLLKLRLAILLLNSPMPGVMVAGSQLGIETISYLYIYIITYNYNILQHIITYNNI
jgi:hypothetical protein